VVGTGREDDEEGWAFGDVWRSGSPDEADGAPDDAFVEILRGDTGRGFDDSLMLDLIAYLGSRGIRATYDSFSLGLEPAAIKTYVLKVAQGSEREARELLRDYGSEGEAGGTEQAATGGTEDDHV
jgi:hypothetical protein